MPPLPPCPLMLIENPSLLGRREVRILAHGFGVDTVGPGWWARELRAAGFDDELFETPNERLTRGDLFSLGERASDSPMDARRLLWATLAWGTGKSNRGNRARIHSVSNAPEQISEGLATAAGLSRESARAAYLSLRPSGKNLAAYLGPPFFSKYLYFAGGGAADHPSLILDSRVARRLQDPSGPVKWRDFRKGYWWTSSEYNQYTDALHSWAQVLSAQGTPVAADQIERWLFEPPPP